MATDNNMGCMGKAIGFPLIVAGIFLLIWNEHHTLHAGRLLDECREKLVTVADTSRVDPANDGMLLFMNAWARQGAEVFDPLYNVGGRYMAVERKVEYCQWKEFAETVRSTDEEGNYDSRTVYRYSRIWSDRLINSENFHGSGRGSYDNTPLTRVDSHKTYSEGAMFGPYLIHNQLMDSLPRITMDQYGIDEDDPQFAAAIDSTTRHGKVRCHIMGDTIYYGDVPADPIAGDVRVVFRYYRPSHIWALVQAHGDSIRPFVSSEGYWHTFARFSPLAFEPGDALDFAVWGQNMLTWVLRFVGWLMLVFGIKKVLDVVVALLGSIPIVGALADVAAFAVSLALGTVLALLVIGITYVFLRPWLGLAIVCGVAVVCVASHIIYKRMHPVLPPPLQSSQVVPPPLPPKP